jgi:hypothetical protein
MPIFDDQRFLLYDNGQPNIDDYVIITEVGTVGGTYIFDIDITDGGLAETSGATLYKGAIEQESESDITVYPLELANGLSGGQIL